MSSGKKKASEPMSAGGSSDDWEKAKANHIRIGTCFLEHIAEVSPELSAKWGKDWRALKEEHACSKEIYEHVATYLVHTYIIPAGVKNAGKLLGSGTAQGVWSSLIQQSKLRFTDTTNAASLKFFKCGDKGITVGPEADWFNGIRTKIGRLIFQRDMFGPDSMDHTQNELFLSHIRDLCEALAHANTPESAERKLAIKSLWRCAGRAGEPEFLSLEGLKWNALHQTPCIESPQSKPSKLKFVPFVAGPDRLSDWLIDFGDFFVLQRGATLWSSEEKTWLLPSLQGGGAASTKLSSYIKGMQPAGRSGALGRYADYSVHSLPPAPTAAGVRPGAADTLCMSVPAELAVHTTGHDLTDLSALWEYLHSRISLCIPGALCLSGWPPLPYGQTGKGPAHPSLQPLLDCGESLEHLEHMIDVLFSFHDASPPMLLVGGPLRPMMHATLATMVMYYDERFEAKEMHLVLACMRDAYKSIAAPRDDAHMILIEWGRRIKAQFDMDNAHLDAGRSTHEAEFEQLMEDARRRASAAVAAMLVAAGQA